MDVWAVDFWANNWDSAFHRASPFSKVLAAGLTVAAVVLTDNFVILAVVYLSIAAAIIYTRLPAPKILVIGAYPAIFAILFAASRWDGSILTPATIILRTLTAALAMLMLVTTTSYPDIFATFQFIMPRAVADGLFLAYRSLFILLALTADLMMALKLRGGLRRRHYVRNAKNMASGLGLLLVRAISLSERLYAVMRVRGYSGRLASRSQWQKRTEYDALPLGLGLWIIALVVSFRLWPEILSAYNGYILVATIIALLSSIVYARWPHQTLVRRR